MALLHGLAVRPQNRVAPGENAREREGRRSGQIEVGDQRTRDLQALPRQDKHVGPAGTGGDNPCRPLSIALGAAGKCRSGHGPQLDLEGKHLLRENDLTVIDPGDVAETFLHVDVPRKLVPDVHQHELLHARVLG